jgi:hypothetical protein
VLLFFLLCAHINTLQHYTDAWMQYCKDKKLCRAALHALRDYTCDMAQHSSILDDRDMTLSTSTLTSAVDVRIGTLRTMIIVLLLMFSCCIQTVDVHYVHST